MIRVAGKSGTVGQLRDSLIVLLFCTRDSWYISEWHSFSVPRRTKMRVALNTSFTVLFLIKMSMLYKINDCLHIKSIAVVVRSTLR